MIRVARACIAAIAVAAPSFAADPVGLTYERTAVDLGRLAAGSTREVKIPYSNKTGETRTIVRTSEDCGCLSLLSSLGALLPGDSGELRIQITAPRHQARVKAPIVLVDDRNREDRIEVSFSVDPPITLAPARLSERRILGDQPVSRAIRVLGPMAQVVSCEAGSPAVKAALDRETGLLRVEMAAQTALGVVKHKVLIRTREPERKYEETVELPVEVTTEAPVRIEPAALDLGAVEPGSSLTRSVRLTNLSPSGYTLAVKTVEKPAWGDWADRCDVQAASAGLDLCLTITIPTGPAILRGAVALTLDDALSTKLQVPITALVVGSAGPGPSSPPATATPPRAAGVQPATGARAETDEVGAAGEASR